MPPWGVGEIVLPKEQMRLGVPEFKAPQQGSHDETSLEHDFPS